MTTEPTGDPVRVAICDDALGFPLLVAEWLRSDGRFQPVGIVDAGGPLEALVAETLPEVVVLDVVLPDVDHPGPLIERLRTIRPGLRVVLVSSLAHDMLAGIARDAGADGHVNKASTPGELCDAVHRAARST